MMTSSDVDNNNSSNKNQNNNRIHSKLLQYCLELESRLQQQSDELENIHLEAAIDASTDQLLRGCGGNNNDRTTSHKCGKDDDDDVDEKDDPSTNPNSVQNCLSPYVPTPAERIATFFAFINHQNLNQNHGTTTTTTTIIQPEIPKVIVQQQQQLQQFSDTDSSNCQHTANVQRETSQLSSLPVLVTPAITTTTTPKQTTTSLKVRDNEKEEEEDIFLDIGCGDGRVCFAACALSSIIRQLHTATTTSTTTDFNSTNTSNNDSYDHDSYYRPISKVIGIDISPPCIRLANETLINEKNIWKEKKKKEECNDDHENDKKEDGQLKNDLNHHNNPSCPCLFYQCDIVEQFDLFMKKKQQRQKQKQQFQTNEVSPIRHGDKTQIENDDDDDDVMWKELQSVTVIFLYTYPTLLYRLVPFLSWLITKGKVRAIVTLTYHLPDPIVDLYQTDRLHDFQWYTNVRHSNTTTLPVKVVK